MTTKSALLTITDPYQFHNKCWDLASQHALLFSGGNIDPIIWHRNMERPDVYLAFSGFFYGTWENSGCFFHQAGCWSHTIETVIAMFSHFGQDRIGSLFAKAVEFDKAYKDVDSDDLPETVRTVMDHIEKQSSFGSDYTIMAEHIRNNFPDYLTFL